jgi:hypothetical protein
LVLTAAARSTAWSLPKFHPLPTIFPSRISSRAELHRSDFLLDGFVHPAELVFMGVAVPHELGAGLFVPDPVSTLARFLRRCSVLLFSFDLAAGAGLRAKKNSSCSRSSALIFGFSRAPLLGSVFTLRFLARSAGQFLFVLSPRCFIGGGVKAGRPKATVASGYQRRTKIVSCAKCGVSQNY